MSISPRNNRHAFRPTLENNCLEDRVVLNGASGAGAAIAAQVGPLQADGGARSGQANPNALTTAQTRNGARQQLGAARTDLRQLVRDRVTTLFDTPANLGSNGRPTPKALANLNANMGGALDATTLRLSARASLLPASSRRLVPNLQASLPGARSNSLIGRISNGTPANRVAPVAQAALLGTGVAPFTGQPEASFAGGMSGMFPSVNSSTPFTPNSFATGFQGASTTGLQGFSTPISQSFVVPVRPASGGTFELPSGFFQTGATFPSAFGMEFTGSAFNDGFNNGFLSTDTGFSNLGMTPAGFNTNFSTDFNTVVNGLNQEFGIVSPGFVFGGSTSTSALILGSGVIEM